MGEPAFWKTLYTPGHDAALLDAAGEGWRLSGTAVFLHDGVPACLSYVLDLDPDWSTRRGAIDGFAGTTPVARRIERNAEGWTLDGVPQTDVQACVDLDFGFTPATNCPQLRRMALEVGQSAEIVVAWLDVAAAALAPLPQRYRRVREDAYAYESPQNDYRATLRIAGSGFVRDYPGLWEMAR
ncbi:putative glycolipid-binding domain-containing protein [Sphingomonas sp. G-3-2-10]|uniref:putative glycolipid-binding domain-containing protein n=1 Tax=Sphingomonas sp. G-3-2-10 TaxID=2728838 RepID=UPI00146E37D5|nr:putative glycolipid-binding domain-containing protein [Sphingomonas sp. G-3-2-10]NML05040.1 putative glycolipid-binding domain-containing protein [Sphingomonas sp. G-3-2-10]